MRDFVIDKDTFRKWAPRLIWAIIIVLVAGFFLRVALWEHNYYTKMKGSERAAASIVLRDPNVSRRHAQITLAGTEWSIEDLNSTNGTLVNNRRITRCPLRNGDLLTFGLSTFEFRG